MKSVLEEFYKNMDRPISQKELTILSKKNFKNLKLSHYETFHTTTGYFYLLKKNGKKEQDAIRIHADHELTSKTIKNLGTCSITWKLHNTPEELKDLAHNIVDEYCKVFKDRPLWPDGYLSHYEVELIRVFYIWLYYERYP
jgi:hypothetical protein